MVRGAVGVCDVTTLGKIDVQGPDAAAFLDRVYANTISTLAVGRVRYGLMLREDGFVMDDGTVARLGERHFLRHHHHRGGRAGDGAPRVLPPSACGRSSTCRLISVTEQLGAAGGGGAAVAGAAERRARRADRRCRLPVHGLRRGAGRRGGGTAVPDLRSRASSAYELAVPARFGAALCARCWRRARPLGGGPYGHGGAERAPDREGAPRPTPSCTGAPPPTTSGSAGCWRRARTASARPARRGRAWPGRSASSWSGCGRSIAAARLLAGAHVVAPGAEPRRRTTRAT